MSTDNFPIDPALLPQNPAMAFFNFGTPTLSGTSSSAPTDDEDDDDGLPPNPGGLVPITSSSGANAPASRSLIGFGRAIKQRKDFNPATEAEFDNFCTALSLNERMTMMFATVLETRELMKGFQKDDQWTLLESLKKVIRIYAQVFCLSPTTMSYRGKAAEHILAAMGELKVPELPAEKDHARVKAVITATRAALTSTRNVMKGKIQKSIVPSAATRNIANLTQALIANTPVQPTLQLYMRVAFLRWHIVTYPSLEDKAWWPQIDLTISEFRKAAQGDERKISVAFTNMYIQDKATYGDPELTSHRVVEPKDITSWTTTLFKHAAQVQGPMVQGPTKRTRSEAMPEEEEEAAEDN